MSTFHRATVTEVKDRGKGICEAALEFEDGGTGRGLVLEQLVGEVSPGDLVVANTTAVDLGLGSGGYHFVLWNLANRSVDTHGSGHIMKLRYTPLQFNVEAAEESLGIEADGFSKVLEGIPVVTGSLHSQLLAATLAYCDARPDGRLVYVMTDGGALPAAFSDTIRFLRQRGSLASVITCGHAFGGDREAVTLHGALAAAGKLDSADAVIVLMGPGIVGTGSTVGFTGMEQGLAINAAASLGGMPVAIPRITFGDARDRHSGLSHHTIAALKYGAFARSVIAVPLMEDDRTALVRTQLEESGLLERHDVEVVDASGVIGLIDGCGFKTTVMGRSPSEEPEFFMAAGAAGILAAGIGGEPDGV